MGKKGAQKMEQIMETLAQGRIIAIARGIPGDQIGELARALMEGGITMLEVTFDQTRPESWQDTCRAIARLDREFSGRLLPGAGTVLTREQVALARDAGAKYIISPDANEAVIRETKRLGLASFPGAMTPTEIAAAWRWGADAVKVFPAGKLGPDYIRAIRAPLRQIPLLAVGGVSEKNAGEFIRAGCLGVGVGGLLVDAERVKRGEMDKITALAQEYRRAVS